MSTFERIINKKKNRQAYVALAAITIVAFSTVFLMSLRAAADKEPDTQRLQDAVQVINKDTLKLSDATVANLGTVKASTKDFPLTLDIMGSISVVENLLTVVSSRVNDGRVDEVFKVTGETVHAGEPLALIYSPDYVSAREEYLQVISRDGTTKDGSTDAGDLSDFEAVAKKKLEMMGLSATDIAGLPNVTDNHLVVRALRDGIITSVNTMVGNIQNQGDTLFTTANLDKVWFSGDLYIEDLPKVHEGQRVKISAEGLDKPLGGTISFISPVEDANVRTVKVRAMIDNPGHLLRASMFVRGKLVLKDEQSLVVPQDAVLTLNDKSYCFKAIGQNRFEEVPVTVSRQSDNVVGILGGLASGDEVVSKDLATLDHVLDSGRAND